LTLGYRDLRLEAADLAAFYRSRVARIMPAFLTIQVLGLFWFPPALVGGGPKWNSVNVFSFAGLQAWFLARMPYGSNGGTWSISVELFSALFPVAPPVMRPARRPFGTARVGVYLALGCSVLGLIGCAIGENFFSNIAPYCRLPEFLFGIVVGLMLADPARAGSRAALALVGAGVLAALAAVNPAYRSGLWTRAIFLSCRPSPP